MIHIPIIVAVVEQDHAQDRLLIRGYQYAARRLKCFAAKQHTRRFGRCISITDVHARKKFENLRPLIV